MTPLAAFDLKRILKRFTWDLPPKCETCGRPISCYSNGWTHFGARQPIHDPDGTVAVDADHSAVPVGFADTKENA